MKKRIISLLLVLSMLLCVLPAASAIEPAPNFTKYSLSLNKSIAINFKVPYEDVEGKFEKVMFTKGDETTEIKELPAADKDGMAVFTFRDLSPSELATSVTAALVTSDGTESVTKSVKDYCLSMLGKEISGNLQRLIVDLLNYGSAFQTWKISEDLPADSTLVNSYLSAEQLALATKVDPELKSDLPATNTSAITKAGVALEDSVRIRFEAAEGVATLKVNGTTVEANEKGYFYYDKLNPAQMRDVVTAQAYDSEGKEVGDALTYSIVSYAHYQTNNQAATAELKALVKEMIKYGDSAAAYVGDPDGAPIVTPTEPVLLEDNFDDANYDGWTHPNSTDGSAVVEDGKLKLAVKYSGTTNGTGGKQFYVRRELDEACSGKVRIVVDYKRTYTSQYGAYDASFSGYLTILGDSGYAVSVDSRGNNFTVTDGGPATDPLSAKRYPTNVPCIAGDDYKIEVVLDTETDTYTLYINENLVWENRRLQRDVSSVTEIMLEAKDNLGWLSNRYVYFDNLKVTQVTE